MDKNKMNIISVPVLPIYEFFCDPEIGEKFHDDIFSKEIKWKDTQRVSGFSPVELGKIVTDNYFFNSDFFNWVQSCLDRVVEINIPKTKVSISEYWLTRSKFGQSSHEHSHPCSLFSGLYYFTDQDKSSTIFKHDLISKEKFKILSLYGSAPITVHVNPQKYKLIIFPSFLEHKFIMKDKNTRYTLAFNTFFNGVIGEFTASELELKLVPKIVNSDYSLNLPHE